MAAPFVVDGDERFLNASIGIASIRTTARRRASSCVKNADTAMYRAKAGGRGRDVYFEDRMNVGSARAREPRARAAPGAWTQTEFRSGTSRSSTFVPAASPARRRCCGGRVNEHGLRLAGRILHLAEEVGLIEPLGRWILDQACARYKLLASQGIRLDRLSVNVSARQFRQSDFVDFVASTAARHAVPPHCLELEITESLLMSANDEVDQALRALKDLGIRLAIDDFGTGYSSLAYLKQFSFDVVKIDRSFVKDLETNAESRAITSAIIAMAHALRKEVVAEGVETEGQLAILRSLACDQIQGYFLAQPLAPREFMEFAAARIAAPALS